MEENNNILSVVICTYNRANLLRQTLESLKEQVYTNFELIVIDNNSIDSTRQVVDSFFQFFSKLRYVFEPNSGLSIARNTGFFESTGQYIAYLDDDVILDSYWVKHVLNIAIAKSYDIFGGPVFPYYLKCNSKWFKDEYHTFEFGKDARVLDSTETLIGCNFIVKKDIISQIGLFRVDLGMSGSNILYSEETEFQLRYLKIVPTGGIFYDPSLFVHHFLRSEKMTMCWNIQAFIGKGKSNFLRYHNSSFQSSRMQLVFNLFFTLLKTSVHFCRCLIIRDRILYPRYQNYVMEVLHSHFKKIGFLYCSLRLRR